MSKTKKIMFGIAVAAVASLNVYVANDVIEQNNATSLLNLDNIADAGFWGTVKSTLGEYFFTSTEYADGKILTMGSVGNFQLNKVWVVCQRGRENSAGVDNVVVLGSSNSYSESNLQLLTKCSFGTGSCLYDQNCR